MTNLQKLKEEIVFNTFSKDNWLIEEMIPRDWFYRVLKTDKEFLKSIIDDAFYVAELINVCRDIEEIKEMIPNVTDYSHNYDKERDIYVCYDYITDEYKYLFKVDNNGTTYLFSKIR